MEKDSEGCASNLDIDVAERERMFQVHVHGLYNVCPSFYNLRHKLYKFYVVCPQITFTYVIKSTNGEMVGVALCTRFPVPTFRFDHS